MEFRLGPDGEADEFTCLELDAPHKGGIPLRRLAAGDKIGLGGSKVARNLESRTGGAIYGFQDFLVSA